MTKPLFVDFDTFEHMKSPLVLLSFLFILLVACHKDDIAMKELDLSSHGLPMTILAPDSAVVQEKDYNFMRDITVKSGDRFFLQIFEFGAAKQDAAGEKLRQLAAVKEDPFFLEVIREEDKGFIFSKMADSTHVDYDFRFVRILGDKELIFQSGLVGTFSLEDVQRMYKAVK
jgi:hypothetical protein